MRGEREKKNVEATKVLRIFREHGPIFEIPRQREQVGRSCIFVPSEQPPLSGPACPAWSAPVKPEDGKAFILGHQEPPSLTQLDIFLLVPITVLHGK